MCRAIGEGGRRCLGCGGPTALAKHNERRRKNRAIKNNVLEWARQEGCDPGELERLRGLPPIGVKNWAKEQGVDPEAFAAGVPSNLPPQPGASIPPVQGAAPGVGAGVPAAGAGGGGGGRHRAAGPAAGGGATGGRRGGAAPPPAAGAGPEPQVQGAWATPELQSQIAAAVGQQGQHRDERSLLAADALRAKAARGGTNETFRIEFDNGMVGYFKPFEGVNAGIATAFGHGGAEQPMHEVAAWRLASQMGEPWSDMVPPVVMREVHGKMGSLALERPGRNRNREPWNVPEWREAAFFDSLIGQQDRHPGNYLVAGDRITLIDHGYSFAVAGNYCNYSHLQRKRLDEAPALTYQERSVLEKVVTSKDVLGLQSLVGAERAGAVRDRAQRMLDMGRVLDTGAY